MSTNIRPFSTSFFGGGFDTNNLGVDALTLSVIDALFARTESLSCTVFDHTRGIRVLPFESTDLNKRLFAHGARWSRAIYRTDSLSTIQFLSKRLPWICKASRIVRRSSSILDISGGDSFTDLYGLKRYEWVLKPKQIAIDNHIPLILLPQTYGPFEHRDSIRKAEYIVRNAAIAIARDERSFGILKDLLGTSFDPAKHRQGVDVAFLLRPVSPRTPLPPPVRQWLDSASDTRKYPIVGFNVSGLIYNDAEKAISRYKFVANYNDAVHGFLSNLLQSTDSKLLLIPHVLTPAGHYESDPHACDQVKQRLFAQHGNGVKDRIETIPPCYNQSEMKWIISKCNWFCGTRMHSTIAGLSSGVSTAAISYSPKTLGVFETCGVGSQVVDPTILDTDELIDALWTAWLRKDEAQSSLRSRLPRVMETAEKQMDLIAEVCLCSSR